MRALSRDHGPFVDTLNDLANADDLVVVTGAGVSIAAGLPPWSKAVECLLGTAARTSKIPDAVAPEAIKKLLASHSLTHAAGLARMLLGDGRDEALRQVLYEHVHHSPQPGPVASAIAQLVPLFQSTELLTTNYDNLQELALLQVPGLDLTIESVVPNGDKEVHGTTGRAPLPIHHLHGYVPPQGGKILQRVILDEQDYFSLDPADLQRLWDAVENPDNNVLFVGLSMTDPNVLMPAFRTSTGGPPRHFGLFVAGGGSAYPGCFNDAVQKRLWSYGLRPVNLTRYQQITQVLIEIANRKQLGDDYWVKYYYGHRIETWRAEIEKKWPHKKFERTQRRLHEALVKQLEEIQAKVQPYQAETEHLALHLWVRNPADPTRLELWATTTSIDVTPWFRNYEASEITAGSSRVAVKAMYYGSGQSRDLTKTDSRWNYVVAMPVRLKAPPWHDIMVGVVTLSSMTGGQSTVLRHEEPLRPQLYEMLHAAGTKLLEP
jgi:hypothetical protein